ncbi:S-methyl-5-thioribose kinase [Paraburkholderia caballeronis]|uniref:S-methyl-5-thioribose kinase n=1 Tax=Paraburkholderia caballeronis TaxID=416943 RepID=A0A1H7V873_9BURK|nr:S-methyl-5-thioribose kinase [Paraburkholderia caballeronis]PXW16470.1 5'-methylthioribose kinase [Paraburkholderia caballeronis]PXW94253.1 5'-methylthioribose kinase [Paraburkholderia caballeronis]RAJ89720.1 5'-methylthioribose kinase [Paraburkholderia caballeronis]SED93175.1 5'-methylthioribose kinase [Paraburkholderia caballeronis]SEM05472.1 5'-methylthioribose kinase [Paraburkholderia caballeronis]
MEFEAFSPSELAAYLKRIPVVSALLGDGELEVVEVGDGNLNYVYFVSNAAAPQRSVVVKQAPPFLRLVGDAWPLRRERMEREVAALRRFGALCPQHVPQVYHADSGLYLMVIQRLASHRVLRGGLIDGIVYPRLAEHMASYLARTLFFGSDLYLAPDAKKAAVAADINSELCKITEDLVFTFPFGEHPSNAYSAALPAAAIARLREHEPLRVAAAQMKWAFMNHAETLVHGDLHTGSIMVNETDTYVIDPEFAFYGPIGFDVGALLANLLLAYYAQDWHERRRGRDPQVYQGWLLDQAVLVWNGFAEKFAGLWRGHERDSGRAFVGGAADAPAAEAFRQRFMQRLFADTLGFAGCKMIRRIVGMAKVADITRIADDAVRAQIEVRCLRLAEALLVQRDAFASIGEVVELTARLRAQPGFDA